MSPKHRIRRSKRVRMPIDVTLDVNKLIAQANHPEVVLTTNEAQAVPATSNETVSATTNQTQALPVKLRPPMPTTNGSAVPATTN